MIFSKRAILQAMQQGKLAITPFNEEHIEAAHINLHLCLEGDTKSMTIEPRGFITARTIEKLTFSADLCGFMEGRASLAKLGVSVEQSSTFIEPGTDGQMTLEIFNASDTAIQLVAGQPVAKLFIVAVVE
jgi:dCTP deaminase